MQINVSGHHMNSGKSLTQYISDRLNSHVTKYFKQAIGADVKYTKGKTGYDVKIRVFDGLGKKLSFVANANGDNPYSVFDMASEKVEKQLRRFKRKIKSH